MDITLKLDELDAAFLLEMLSALVIHYRIEGEEELYAKCGLFYEDIKSDIKRQVLKSDIKELLKTLDMLWNDFDTSEKDKIYYQQIIDKYDNLKTTEEDNIEYIEDNEILPF